MLVSAMMCTMSACGDDEPEMDDDPAEENNQGGGSDNTPLDYTLPASGSLTVYGSDGGQLYVREVYDAGYCVTKADIDDPATLYLRATFKNEGSTSNTSFLINEGRLSEITLRTDGVGRLVPGPIASSGNVEVNHFTSSSGGGYDWTERQGYFEGSAEITEVEANRYVTVRFTDCVCHVDGASGHRFSGSIKFPLRKYYDFFFGY